MAGMTIDTRDQSPGSTSDASVQKSTVPRIPLDLRQKKVPIAISAVLVVTFSGILPVVLYYILHSGANTSDTVAITVSTVIFGAYTIIPLFMRIWSLAKKNSTTRPIGASGRHLDYFQFNFITLFCVLTGMISAGSALAGSDDLSTRSKALPIVSMSLSIIIICVCGQMVIIFIGMSLSPNLRYPFRISSMKKGDIVRPAIYTIIEDVVAVDGKQGTEFRRRFSERYEYSEDIRALIKWADAVWGFSGVTLGAVLIVIIWVVDNKNVGFVLGWIVPWVWASLLTILTIMRTRAACRKENEHYLKV